MKKILMMGVLLCGISFSLFGMDYKKVALSGCTGAATFAFAPILISPGLPKRLIKEAPEAYMGIILFGGALGVAYGLVSPKSGNNNSMTKMNMNQNLGQKRGCNNIKSTTLNLKEIKSLYTICE